MESRLQPASNRAEDALGCGVEDIRDWEQFFGSDASLAGLVALDRHERPAETFGEFALRQASALAQFA